MQDLCVLNKIFRLGCIVQYVCLHTHNTAFIAYTICHLHNEMSAPDRSIFWTSQIAPKYTQMPTGAFFPLSFLSLNTIPLKGFTYSYVHDHVG